MTGKRPHRRQGRERLQTRDKSGMILLGALNVVGEKHEVELTALRAPGDLDKRGDIFAVLGRSRMTPTRDMITGADGKYPETHLSSIHASDHTLDTAMRSF